jgi:WhiB family redox-sensing transcriptional regulator
MTTMRGRTDWREGGACAHDDPDLYFPISSTGSALRQIAKAKATCAGCPVRQACLEFALEHDLIHGIWGGTTPEDRQAWRHERRSGRLRAATRRASLNPPADVRKIFMPNGCGFSFRPLLQA